MDSVIELRKKNELYNIYSISYELDYIFYTLKL